MVGEGKRAKVEEEEEHEEERAEEEDDGKEGADDKEEEEDPEAKIIEEEFRVWKKNAPFLYDVCVKYNTKSAPLTCQWLPPRTEVENDYSSHELLVGMKRTDDSKACLTAMRVYLPNNGVDLKVKEFSEKTQDLGGYANHIAQKMSPFIEVNHSDDVNRARFMPNDYFIVATRMGFEVALFNFSSLESKPKDDRTKPMARGIGHSCEGWGLDWSLKTPSNLLSCGNDGTFLWNVERQGSSSASMTLLRSFEGAAADCAWNPHKADVFATVAPNSVTATMWDIRDSKPVFNVSSSSLGELNAISFNMHNEHIFVTGGSNKVVHLWDDRKMANDKPHYELKGHTGEIYGLQWAPFNENVLASCGDDRRVLIWDLERIGREQTPEEAEDGDPELLFVHGGHCSRVVDISWNPNEDWVLATVADNGLDGDVQVWQMAEHIYNDEDDDDDDKNDLE